MANKGAGFEGREICPPQGTNYLLAIAINEYEHCPRLSNCVKDVNDFIALVTERYCFEKENISTLFDGEATKANIYHAFSWIAEVATPNDNVLIYFSGHGQYFKVFGQGYWIPVEAQAGSFEQYLPNSEVIAILNAIRSHHTFLMVDSCFSGSLFAGGTSRSVGKRYENDPSRWGLSSGRNEIVSDGRPGKNSPFAESLLYRLRQNTGALGVQELCFHVVEYVQSNSNQTPIGEPLRVEGHKNGQFVFHLKKDEGRDWGETTQENTAEAYRHFLEIYPDGAFAGEARRRAGEMEEERAWRKVEEIHTLKAYYNYLETYPEGKYSQEAERKMEALEEERAWKKAVSKNSITGYRRYLKTYPSGKHAPEAHARVNELLTAEEPEKKPKTLETEVFSSKRSAEAETARPLLPKNMILVEGGVFEMGDVFAEGEEQERPVHTVTVGDFYLGIHLVTFTEFDVYSETTGREKEEDREWGRKRRPVIYVSWYEAVSYCNWRSRQEGLREVYAVDTNEKDPDNTGGFDTMKWKVKPDWSANGYRLPTEAEWEFAARQRGQKVRFGNGKNQASPEEINFNCKPGHKEVYSITGPFRGRTTEVMSFSPNRLALYDMSGNVAEWCWDWYGKDYYRNSRNSKVPTGPETAANRVLRGGSWRGYPSSIRCTRRGYAYPDLSAYNIGFRLARNVQ